jgi:hypothetical protein
MEVSYIPIAKARGFTTRFDKKFTSLSYKSDTIAYDSSIANPSSFDKPKTHCRGNHGLNSHQYVRQANDGEMTCLSLTPGG